MTTTTTAETRQPQLVLGETVHYRTGARCWAAAIVEPGPDETAQLYLFPLPPHFPMPQAPGTFVPRDGGTEEDTWHHLSDCADAPTRATRRSEERSRSRSRRSTRSR